MIGDGGHLDKSVTVTPDGTPDDDAALSLQDIADIMAALGIPLSSLRRRKRSIAERFESFHRANPNVYATLARLAREWKRKTGRERCGIAMLFERARWELSITTTETAPVLDNSFSPFFARLLMAQETDLAGMFETRRSVADTYRPTAGVGGA